jgi:hypothetical protein
MALIAGTLLKRGFTKACPVCKKQFRKHQGLGGHLSGPCGGELKKHNIYLATAAPVTLSAPQVSPVKVKPRAGGPLSMGTRTETILEEAQRLVHGDRNRDYGHPFDDFSRTASMATAMLRDKLRPGVELTAEGVGLFMILVKVSRQVNRPKRDNLTDTAGYAATVQMCMEEREKRA